MENLHLKNLDIDKLLKTSKSKELSEQIKVNIQTPTVIDVDEEDEDDKNWLFKSIVKLLMIAWVAVGLNLAVTHPYFVIEIGKAFYNLGESLLSP